MSSINTPDTSHLTAKEFENVYEPAEDSFILLDALENELKQIQQFKPTFAVEIGPGSGIISAALANLTLAEKQSQKLCMVFSCDINISACKATQHTAYMNGVSSNVEIICSDVLTGLTDRLIGKIDLVVCNPPYVVTSDEELINVKINKTGRYGIDTSWAGGQQGCASVTNSLVEALPQILSPKGACYLVLEQSNKPDDIGRYAESLGLNPSIIMKRRAGRELLFVMKLTKAPST